MLKVPEIDLDSTGFSLPETEQLIPGRKAGHTRLAAAVKAQAGSEAKEMVAAQKRATKEKTEITLTINNLLDNITASNRDMVDLRLDELKGRLRELEARLAELDQLIMSQAQIRELATEAKEFFQNLDSTLKNGEPHERLVVLRQCINQITVNKPNNSMTIQILVVPVGGLAKIDTLSIEVSA